MHRVPPPLHTLTLAQDVNAVSNKGYAFFEYADPSVTDICIAALHGFKVYHCYLLDTTLLSTSMRVSSCDS